MEGHGQYRGIGLLDFASGSTATLRETMSRISNRCGHKMAALVFEDNTEDT